MINIKLQSIETLPLLDPKPEEAPLLQQKKLKYPIAVVFVLVVKFFEAFAANGIRTVLALYLRDDLGFAESSSTVILHVFNFFCQFCPIIGAIIADNYTGPIKAVSYFFVLYAVGWLGLIVTSIPWSSIPSTILICIFLLLIAVGNGSVKACIASLGASQFIVPQQNNLLRNYFSLYYFFFYLGVAVSYIIPPFIRANTHCFNKPNCYTKVFAALGVAFITCWFIFLIGIIFFKRVLPTGKSIILQFYHCVQHAVVTNFKNRDETSKRDWLSYSNDLFTKEFVDDVRTFLKVLKLFIPLPIFYALLVQQDSTWTFQASQLNTTIYNINFQPDQIKAMGPIFMFAMIPIWQYICVPLLERCGVGFHPLLSISTGGMCAAFSFITAGLLQMAIQTNTVEKSISVIWQVPQFVLLMLGEVFVSIPGLHFAFTQAPPSMKSVLTAVWFLNQAFGNLIVVVVVELALIENQSSLYFTYAILMFLSTIIFTYMACGYLKKEILPQCGRD